MSPPNLPAAHTVFTLTSEVPHVTGAQLDLLAAALNDDQKRFAAAWGLTPARIIVKKHVQSAPPGAVAIRIVGTASVPDAEAWHTEDEQGRVFVEVYAPPKLGVLTPNEGETDSVSIRTDHEIKETLTDAAVNRWIDRFDGTEVALESVDPVQGDSYRTTAAYGGVTAVVALANFVLPAWFDAQSAARRWDAMGTTPGALRLARGGYQVLRAVGHELPVQWGKAAARARFIAPQVALLVEFDDAVPAADRERARRRVTRRYGPPPTALETEHSVIRRNHRNGVFKRAEGKTFYADTDNPDGMVLEGALTPPPTPRAPDPTTPWGRWALEQKGKE